MKSVIHTFSQIAVGDSASIKHRVTREDVRTFAKLSGDANPLHTDASYAKKTQFKKIVTHGMFLGALVSQLIGMKLPGAYALLIKESLEFKKPVFLRDTVIVKGIVVHKSEATRLVELSIDIKRSGETVAAGRVHARLLR